MSMLLKNIQSNFFNRIAVALTTFMAIPFLVTNLGEQGYGIYALLTMLILYLTIADIGISKSIARYIAAYRSDSSISNLYSTFFSLLCFIAFFTMMLSIIFEKQLLQMLELGSSTSKYLYYICVATAVSMMFRSYFIGVLFGHENFIFYNTGNIIFEIIKWSLIVYLSYLKTNALEAIMAIQLLIITIQTIILFLYCKINFFNESIVARPQMNLVKEILGFSSKVALSDFFTKIISYADKIIVAVVGSVSGLSYYYIAFQVSSKIFEAPSNILLAFYPKFAVAYSENNYKELASLFKMSTRIIMLTVTPIIYLLFIGSQTLLILWLGYEVAMNTFVLLKILSIGTLFACALVPSLNLINAIGYPQYVLINNAIASVFVIGAGIILVQEYGAIGGIIAWSLAQLFPIIFILPKASNILKISIFDYLVKFVFMPISLIGLLIIVIYNLLLYKFEEGLLSLTITYLLSLLVIYRFFLTSNERLILLEYAKKIKISYSNN
jgi:O-antigen/teichoic acid export membrane protein